jgi:REP element-mobilizing transposase RayT
MEIPVPSNPRSQFSHYLPRLQREFYQNDAVVFWTLPIDHRETGWLNDSIHSSFRELMLHAAARQGLLCPAYCLMPDHLHLVWMGLRCHTDQRNAMTWLRSRMEPLLKPYRWQHQAHDHVLTDKERRRGQFTDACSEYVLLNPWRAGLVSSPREWRYLGAVIPGYFGVNPFAPSYWPWFWERYAALREEGVGLRRLPPRTME